RASVDAFAEDDVHAKVFHRRVYELLDHTWHAMDFVDEEDRTFVRVSKKRHEVHRLGQRRPAGHLDRCAEVFGEHRGKSSLAEAGWPVEEDMRQGFVELPGGVESDAETLDDRLLADNFLQPARPQGGVTLLFIFGWGRLALHDGLPCHALLLEVK